MKNFTNFLAATLILLGGVSVVNAQAPTEPAPALPYADENVGAFYSAVYDVVSTWQALVWGQNATVTDVEIGDDQAMKITNLDFLPMQLDSKYVIPNDFDYIHLDVFPSADTKFRIGFQCFGPAFEIYSKFYDLKGGQWNAVDIPLNEFEWPLKNDAQERIAQIMRFGGDEGTVGYASEIYISNIVAYKGEPVNNKPKAPTEPAPALPYADENVGAFYSAVYDVVSTWQALVWGQNATVTDVEIGDDQAMKITNLDFLPMQLDSKYIIPNDFDYIHLDVFPSDNTRFRIGFQCFGPAFEIYSNFYDLKGGEWNAVDIPLNEFEWPLKNDAQERIAQIMRFGGNEGSVNYASDIYVSNIVAYKGSPVGIAQVNRQDEAIHIYPTLVADVLNIEGEESADVTIYSVNGLRVDSYNNVNGFINLSHLNKGFYIVSAKLADGKVVNKRIIKQ
ncbi:T9SS type A sorting domain-containing protein [Bacteroides sp.]